MKKTSKSAISLLLLATVFSCHPPLRNGPILPISTKDDSLLMGKIFVGSAGGEYWVYDLAATRSDTFVLSPSCKIMASGQNAICQRERRLFNVDLTSMRDVVLPIPEVDLWKVTPNQEGILYTVNKVNGSTEIYYYDLSQGFSRRLATIDSKEWSIFPELSSDRHHLIGERRVGSRNILIDIAPQDGSFRELGPLPSNIQELLELSWSPVDAIIGLGATEVKWEGVNRCYTTLFLVYNLNTGEIRQIAHAPAGEECYEFFNIAPRNIWAPNGAEVALVAGRKLCVLTIAEGGGQNCYEIAREGEAILRVSWSPNSRFLAYILEDAKDNISLHIISDDGQIKHSVAIASVTIQSQIVDVLWSSP